MSSSVANIMDKAMFYLYRILANQSSIQLSDKYELQEHKYTSIIVFQRYISEIKAIFLYAYDSNSYIIIQQKHFDVDQLTSNLNKYYEAIEDFLTHLLHQHQEVCLHFINYDPDFVEEKVETILHALRLLELPSLQSKIIIWMNNQQQVHKKNGYLMIQYSLNQSVLLKFQQDIIKNQECYEEFTLKQIKQVQDTHEEFIKQLKLNEQYVQMYNIYSLIKDITFIHDIPNSIYYLAKFLMNLPKYTWQDTLTMISKLKLFKQNHFYQQIQKQPKQKNDQYQQEILTQLAPFKEEKNRHFPMKGPHSQKCKVCQKQNNHKIHKSSFICESCHKYYNINITLCTNKCFKQFHLNPAYYLKRNRRKKQAKVEE
ncbi:unnamed protein product [Paramecium primaurelia]|uniref:Uncharacterized protein n=1 Tax=Paramecium primaurelia TaxID=5886 RepID=A0A8S1Q641_PARPR|nr:unnamed protein product [Paramecium primaurelia]